MKEIFEIGLTCHRCMNLKNKKVIVGTLVSQQYIPPKELFEFLHGYELKGAFLFCNDCKKEVRKQFKVEMDKEGPPSYEGEEV